MGFKKSRFVRQASYSHVPKNFYHIHNRKEEENQNGNECINTLLADVCTCIHHSHTFGDMPEKGKTKLTLVFFILLIRFFFFWHRSLGSCRFNENEDPITNCQLHMDYTPTAVAVAPLEFMSIHETTKANNENNASSFFWFFWLAGGIYFYILLPLIFILSLLGWFKSIDQIQCMREKVWKPVIGSIAMHFDLHQPNVLINASFHQQNERIFYTKQGCKYRNVYSSL